MSFLKSGLHAINKVEDTANKVAAKANEVKTVASNVVDVVKGGNEPQNTIGISVDNNEELEAPIIDSAPLLGSDKATWSPTPINKE